MANRLGLAAQVLGISIRFMAVKADATHHHAASESLLMIDHRFRARLKRLLNSGGLDVVETI